MASAASVAYGGVDTTGGLPNGVLATSASASTGSRISSGGLGILGLGGSSKGLSTSRSVYDDDEDLVAARAEVTRLEMQFADAAEASEKLAHSRRSLTAALTDFSVKLNNLGAVEEIRPPSLRLGLPYVLKRTAYTARSLGELQDALSNTELLTIGDAVAYQSINARAAKEAMLARNALVEEHHNAQKATVNKKREAEHLKMQRNLRADRVDDALEELEEAKRHEHALALHLKKISQELHNSLQSHSRYAHQDLQQALAEHARGSVMFARQLLKEMRALRSPMPTTPNAWSDPSPMGTPSLSQSMHAASGQPMSRNSTQDDPFASGFNSAAGAGGGSGPPGTQSMFLHRPNPANTRPNPFGTLNSGSSGTASGRSRISASEAARSLAGKF
uniref:Sorting nexin/Vps5-like C-terminal domain-containing protein n=1 Tax=Kalmanozyma brasiliensis (strain GHG001) TaxID=1365824 RepID=V5ELU6_KALBG